MLRVGILILVTSSLAVAAPRKLPMYPNATPYGEAGGVSNDDKEISDELWTSKDSLAKVRAWYAPAHFKGFELAAGGDGSKAKPFHIRN
jgi:hypothetical protein